MVCFDTLLEVLTLKRVTAAGVGDFANSFFECFSGSGERLWFRAGFRGWWRLEPGADDAAPGFGVEGVDVFVLGEVDRLQQSLAEIGESGGGPGLDLTLGDGGEQVAQSGAEVAGGDVAPGKAVGDIAAHF